MLKAAATDRQQETYLRGGTDNADPSTSNFHGPRAMNDLTMQAIHSSLRGLSARQRSTADNISNLETPRYLANRVSFEDDLKNAIRRGNPIASEVNTRRSLAPTGVNGNNVNLDEETLSMIDTNLRYQLMVEAMNAKFRILRTAIRGN